MSKGFFVTGTDTEIGKTHVTGCIGHTLVKLGHKVIPFKPIASGCIRQKNSALLSEDALFLQQACRSLQSLEQICPYCFEAAVSPQLAITQANQHISIEDLASNIIFEKNAITLVEGAGGFYSPIASDGLNSDLAKKLALPVILVVGDRLGCINHALLSIDAIRNTGLNLKAVIVNQLSPNSHYSLGLDEFTDAPIYHTPYQTQLTPTAISTALLKQLFSE